MLILGIVCNSKVVESFSKTVLTFRTISPAYMCQNLKCLVVNEERRVPRKFYFLSTFSSEFLFSRTKEVVECSSKSFCVIIILKIIPDLKGKDLQRTLPFFKCEITPNENFYVFHLISSYLFVF